MEHSVKFEIELTILFTRLGPCFLDNAELGYFTLWGNLSNDDGDGIKDEVRQKK